MGGNAYKPIGSDRISRGDPCRLLSAPRSILTFPHRPGLVPYHHRQQARCLCPAYRRRVSFSRTLPSLGWPLHRRGQKQYIEEPNSNER